MKLHLSTQGRINEVIKFLAEIKPNGEYQANIIKLPKKRTLKQNSTIHKWFEYIADEFNKVGQELNINGMAMSPYWTKDLIKELSFKPVMIELVGKSHTSDCTIDELSEVIDVVRTGLESIGHDIAVPSKEQLRGKS